ncbi:MAG: class I adenylate-forming enzyme family protein [SAR324 cluster bacterium]|nr:class I adenylate-forming enzyme family protein [SAR324 cluster bacterium]
MPLTELMYMGGDHPFLLDQGQVVPFTRFAEKAAGIYAWLETQPSQIAGLPNVYSLFAKDPFLLGASLLALWHFGASAILLPNDQPETVTQSLGVSVGFISDNSATKGSNILDLKQVKAAPQPVWGKLDPEQNAVSLFTSGSSGEPKEIKKKLKHINEEIKALETRFGPELHDSVVTSSVYAVHLYGLLFRLLWPLAAHRVFERETQLMPESFVASCKATPNQCFISGPAILKRFCDFPHFPSGLKPNLVFSSGGPLAPKTSDQWLDLFGKRPIEILGSTETGGIAEKHFTASTSFWQAFATVKIDQNKEKQLQVHSPFFAEPRDPFFIMGDAVEIIGDGQFQLKGRVDRTVKIEEKRINLVEMEQKLAAFSGIKQVVLLESTRIFPLKKRQSIVAVAQVNPELVATDELRRRLISELKAHLRAWYLPQVIPRYWRFLDVLPLGPAGKPDYVTICKNLAE